jgi:hypothetical protein
MQSAYRKYHSTETALQAVLNDIYRNIDCGKLTLLVSLDISAAFDTIEHSILLRRLQNTFGISGLILKWIESYLTNRKQFVKIGDVSSSDVDCEYGVPQGSCLGPVLFVLYCSPIAEVIGQHGLKHHQYADDTQLYISFENRHMQPAVSCTQTATKAVRDWFATNGLSLNPDKSEVMFLGTYQRLAIIPDDIAVDVAGSSIKPSEQIKSLGVIIDEKLGFDKHVSNICKLSYSNIRALRQIRPMLSKDDANTVACAIVSTRLDYCNSILYGITSANMLKLQRVQNALARVVSGKRRFDHITPTLVDLHWLPIKERIMHKIGTLTFKVGLTRQPSYLADLLKVYIPPRLLRSSSKKCFTIPRTKTQIGSRAFSVVAPTFWNELPEKIKQTASIENFKKSLKTFLFVRAYM